MSWHRSGFERHNGIWTADVGYVPAGFTPERRDHLRGLEAGHFWFPPRQRLIASLLKRFAAGAVEDALEVGCGTGRVLPLLHGYADNVCAADGHLAMLEDAHVRSPETTLFHGPLDALPFDSAGFDLLVALDVLEHVEPGPFLAELSRVGRPRAKLLLSVPAFDWLWSAADEIAGHRCRYGLRQLREELAANGWQIEHHTHYQFFLFPVLLASRLLRRQRPPGLERRPPDWLNRVLEAVNQVEVSLFEGVRLPYGSSLVVVASKAP